MRNLNQAALLFSVVGLTVTFLYFHQSLKGINEKLSHVEVDIRRLMLIRDVVRDVREVPKPAPQRLTPAPTPAKEPETEKPTPPTETKEYHLPKGIIAGWSKCGTRALLDFLSMHPDVAVADRELDYFNRNYEEGDAWYKEQFPKTYRSDIVMEKSPEYVHSKETPERIYKMNSTMRVIIAFCDPVRRAVSEYVQHMAKLTPEEEKPFKEFALTEEGKINSKYYPIARGRFSYYMEPWLKRFPLGHMHFVDGDAFRANPLPELKKAADYMGLKPYFSEENIYFNATKGFYCRRYPDGEITCEGASKGRPHPTVDDVTLQKLKDFYAPYNKELFDMIRRSFKW